MKFAKDVAKMLILPCATFALIGAAGLSEYWWRPIIIFGGLYLFFVLLAAFAEYEGIV